jgi:hypothetical protein
MNPISDSSCGSDQAFSVLQSKGPLRSAGENESERFPHGVDQECAEQLHELNNVLVSVLLNTQVMEWKLPSYSRLKRNLHEVQRGAQRGGELVKRLLRRLDAASGTGLGRASSDIGRSPISVGDCALAKQEPGEAIQPEDTTIEPPRATAPAFPPLGKKVPHTPL